MKARSTCENDQRTHLRIHKYSFEMTFIATVTESSEAIMERREDDLVWETDDAI